MAKAVATLADDVQAKSGIIKPDATKIARTLVSSYGATCWEDVKDIASVEFDEAIKEAKLLPISIKKLVAVKYQTTYIYCMILYFFIFRASRRPGQ